MMGKAEWRGAFLALAVLAGVVLVVISWTPGIPGEMLLQSLRLHIIAGAFVLAFILFCLGARWRAVGFVLVVLLAGAHAAFFIVELHGRRPSPAGAPAAELKVLSYNVLTGNPLGAEAAQQIVALAPDIVVVMETPGIESYMAALEKVLPYHLGCDRHKTCDLSVWSRYPIIDQQMLLLPPFQRERLAVVKLDVDGAALTVVATHLSKPYFDEASWFEVDFIGDVLDRIEGPVLLAGDFNAAPWSDTLIYLTRRARLAPPPNHPATWPVRAGPLGVPIDNMFTRGSALIEDIAAGSDSFGSNHRYLLARLALYAP